MKKYNEPQRHFKKIDPILAKLIARINLPEFKPRTNYFESLVRSIVSQQLSTKAASTIFTRFKGLFHTKKFPDPEAVLAMSKTKMRKAGLSEQKVSYIRLLSQAAAKKELDFKRLKKLPDEEVINELVKLKGIGRWTAEMFLMFSLARPDIFSHGDLGLKNAILKWYKVDAKKHPAKYKKITGRWSPHRTLASRYLWASLTLDKN